MRRFRMQIMGAELNLPWLRVHLKEKLATQKGESGRVLHGRSGNFPGLEQVVIDAFPPLLLITTFGEVASDLVETLAAELALFAGADGFEKECFSVIHQNRMGTRNHWQTVKGMPHASVIAKHLGLKFEIQLGGKQNIGLFLDMAEGHRLVRQISPGKTILNLFAYTCAFSVIALEAGAVRVINVDLSKTSLAQGRKNHRLNNLDLKRARFHSHDVMKSMSAFRRMGPFDIVICDPPTYQPPSFKAERDYPKLARRIPELLKPGGEVIACLNAPHMSQDQFHAWFSSSHYDLIQAMGRPASFSESDANRDLKIGHFRLSTPRKSQMNVPSPVLRQAPKV